MSLPSNPRQPESARQGQWLKGCAIFLCSVVAFACLDAFAKDLLSRYSAPLVNSARYSVIIVLAWCIMWVKRAPVRIEPAERTLLICRGAMLGGVSICFMAALPYLPLAEATALYFVSPLIVVLLAPMMLRESVSFKQYAAVTLGMAGMLLIVNPLGNTSSTQSAEAALSLFGTLLMLVAAIDYALVQLLTRKLADVAQNVVITQEDCGTTQGVTKGAIYKGEEIERNLSESLRGRVARTTIAGGLLENNSAQLARWLHQPNEVKPGNKMYVTGYVPNNIKLTDADVSALVAYLESLK